MFCPGSLPSSPFERRIYHALPGGPYSIFYVPRLRLPDFHVPRIPVRSLASLPRLQLRAPRRPSTPVAYEAVPALSPLVTGMARAPKFRFWVVVAESAEEQRSAAVLRAQLFYKYPAGPPHGGPGDKQEEAAEVQRLFQKKLESEIDRDWAIEAAGLKVTCLLAVCDKADAQSLRVNAALPAGYPTELAPATSAPPELPRRDCPAGISTPLVAIGTLDIQMGRNVQGEALLAGVPLNVQRAPLSKCGYIFNVCVIKEARGRGVATALMEEAMVMSRRIGLRVLYVHVEVCNEMARGLYGSLGYKVEEEETFEVERQLSRPRRMLLSRTLF